MNVRRCACVFFESRETPRFDLVGLLAGGAGVARTRCWLALAPHLEQEVEVTEAEMAWLGRFSPQLWSAADTVPEDVLSRLLEIGLLVSDEPPFASQYAADERYRALNWWPLAAVAHKASCWSGVNSVASMQRLGMDTVVGLLRTCGMPPPTVAERAGCGPDIPLQREAPDTLDALLARRTTCRNFDPERVLEQALFARMLERVFAAQDSMIAGDGVAFLKKHSPSGGGLHATEAYLLVQRVQGIAPGLYHYRPVDHALRPLPAPGLQLGEFACNALAGQHWFAQAPVLVVYAPRIARSYWKYRNHPKAYRALMLDVGHLSQTLYLSATDLGLGAFVTAAINEVEIERAFGLQSLHDGPLAVGGFGWRAGQREIAEFDPAGKVWPQG
ncbi:Nitroreductase [uncultured Stenotrophomonas sp.]|uniref:Nitroreductase n=1 Tax=uncultured Stenotrophomonas sp. TaxID=165438 RepID=A0A1Y5Q955_9GAMM|nr:Nitroreductase [uncultured Stenotrophomonas sp.]